MIPTSLFHVILIEGGSLQDRLGRQEAQVLKTWVFNVEIEVPVHSRSHGAGQWRRMGRWDLRASAGGVPMHRFIRIMTWPNQLGCHHLSSWWYWVLNVVYKSCGGGFQQVLTQGSEFYPPIENVEMKPLWGGQGNSLEVDTDAIRYQLDVVCFFQEHFEQFYEEVFLELAKFGEAPELSHWDLLLTIEAWDRAKFCWSLLNCIVLFAMECYEPLPTFVIVCGLQPGDLLPKVGHVHVAQTRDIMIPRNLRTYFTKSHLQMAVGSLW